MWCYIFKSRRLCVVYSLQQPSDQGIYTDIFCPVTYHVESRGEHGSGYIDETVAHTIFKDPGQVAQHFLHTTRHGIDFPCKDQLLQQFHADWYAALVFSHGAERRSWTTSGGKLWLSRQFPKASRRLTEWNDWPLVDRILPAGMSTNHVPDRTKGGFVYQQF